MISGHDSGHDTGHDLGHNSRHDTGHDLGHDAGYHLGYGSGGMCTKCIIKTIPISRLDPQYTRNNITSTSMFPGQSPSESCTVRYPGQGPQGVMHSDSVRYPGSL